VGTGGVFPQGAKLLGCEADHLLPSSAKVNNDGDILPTPPHVFMAYQLIEHRDNFIFTLWGGRPGDRDSIPDRSRDHFLQSPDRLWLPSSIL
jgi:hypothetical protein